jgi:hypothetical protein
MALRMPLQSCEGRILSTAGGATPVTLEERKSSKPIRMFEARRSHQNFRLLGSPIVWKESFQGDKVGPVTGWLAKAEVSVR